MKYFLLLIALYITNFSHAQCFGNRYHQKVFSKVKLTKNIASHNAVNAAGKNQDVLMDVFEPLDDTMNLRPLIIFQHGGAYWTGTKDYESQIAMGNEFAKRGYVLASATYRLEPNFFSLIFPDKMLKAVGRGVQDTKKQVLYFYESARNGNEYNIDTNKIFLVGASAGAFNVMHAVYLDNEDSLSNEWRTWLNDIGGVFGNYDFIDFGTRIAGVVNINGALGDKSYLNNEHLPFLSVHNTKDPEIPFNRGRPYNIFTLMYVDGSNVLHQKANELNIYNPFYIIPDNGHTSYSLDFFGNVVQPFFDSTVWYMNKFFIHQLGCDITTGIKKNNIKNLKVYPNPTSNFITIDYNFNQHDNLSIFDMNGKEVYQSSSPKNNYTIQELNLIKGTYILNIESNREIQINTTKLIIQ